MTDRPPDIPEFSDLPQELRQEPLASRLLRVRAHLQAPPQGTEAVELSARLEQVSQRIMAEAHYGERGATGPWQASIHPDANGHKASHRNRTVQKSWFRSWTFGASMVATLAVLLAVAFKVIPNTDRSPLREHITDRGARTTINLADGTVVILGAESKLSYRSLDGSRERAVYLEGEAYFDVASKSDAPFIVYTAHSATQVLGTTFGVRSYQDDSVAQIVVTSGKVAIRPRNAARGTGVTLVAGDLGRINASGLATVAHEIPAHEYLDWTRGTLTFTGATLGQAIRDIERWYDIRIRLSDPSLVSVELLGTLSARSGQEAVQRIADVLNLRISKDGHTITLLPAGTP
jgi:transmembrane sensor